MAFQHCLTHFKLPNKSLDFAPRLLNFLLLLIVEPLFRS